MHAPTLECVESRHGEAAQGCVVWLHGLGADGHDFEPLVPALGLPLDFVFPHAPVRPVTMNGGMPMRAWFDIYSLDRDSRMDTEGLAASARAVEALIAAEHARGTPMERIVLAGFSQGGALALHAGLRLNLAGLVGLSCWLPPGTDPGQPTPGTPILLAHGCEDPVVDHAFGMAARDALRALGRDVEWNEYPMSHAVCAEEVADIGNFLARVLDLQSRSML